MTSLDPSHFPLFPSSDSRTSGQSTLSSISPFSFSQSSSPSTSTSTSNINTKTTKLNSNSNSTIPSSAKSLTKEKLKEQERKEGGRIPTPILPDFRFEEGVLLSIRPFLHRLPVTKIDLKGKGKVVEVDQDQAKEEKEKKEEIVEKVAIISQSFTAEGLKEGEENDLFNVPLKVEWLDLIYVLFRDQVVYSLIQGFIFGIGGVGLNALWRWNKNRLHTTAAAASTLSTTGVKSNRGLLARLGLKL